MQQRTYITVLLAAALAAAGCGTEQGQETPAPLVRTMTVGDAARSEAGYTGAVRGRYETRLAFPVGGQIRSWSSTRATCSSRRT